MRISDWSSDVCSSDLAARADLHRYAHIQAIDAIFAVDIGGAGQDSLLVAQIGFGHSDAARGRSVEGRTGAEQRDALATAAAGALDDRIILLRRGATPIASNGAGAAVDGRAPNDRHHKCGGTAEHQSVHIRYRHGKIAGDEL